MPALEECDLCHDTFSIQSVRLEGTQILCDKCRRVNRVRNQIEASKQSLLPEWYKPKEKISKEEQ